MKTVFMANDSNFQVEVMDQKGLVLVDFWAEWCGPCKMMLPILDEFATLQDNVKVVKVNVDESPSIAWAFRIMSIPTLILFKDGKPVEVAVWVNPIDNLKALVAKHSD